MLVCSECTNKDACIAREDETRAAFCRTPDDKKTIRAVWREYIPGDQLYADPQGEPYKGLTEFIQTPMIDPVKPRTADEIFKEAIKKHREKYVSE
jgi:hypothetical protein